MVTPRAADTLPCDTLPFDTLPCDAAAAGKREGGETAGTFPGSAGLDGGERLAVEHGEGRAGSLRSGAADRLQLPQQGVAPTPPGRAAWS